MSLASRIKKLERARTEGGGRACAECGGSGHVELLFEGTPPIGGPCPACGEVMQVVFTRESTPRGDQEPPGLKAEPGPGYGQR